MLSPMIPVLILLSWLRNVGASGELCDVTGRLPGEKVELDFPGRRLGGIDADGALACYAPDGAPATPSGDSKLRLLAISSLPGLFAPAADVGPTTSPATTPAAIIPGDLILIIGRSGELLHAGTVTSDGRLAHIPLKGAVGVPKKGTPTAISAFFAVSVPKIGTSTAPRRVSVRSLAAYCARWRKAAGVMVLRKPWLPYHYTKREVLIPMRDGVRLYTAIYEPYGEDAAAFSGSPVKNARKCKTPLCSGVGGPSKSFENDGAPSCNASEVGPRPIVLMRSPYPVGTYGYGGPGDLSDKIRCFTERGYIIVEQNVRGTYMSEGEFEDVRPLIHDLYACSVTGQAHPPAPVRLQHHRSDQDPHTCAPIASQVTTSTPTDESTDAYDTIDWLLENTRNNGSVGIYGVSYPGFYATCAAICGHPALKIVSPQAPVTDWWMGDDAHHNGALMLCDMYGFGASFFRPKGNPTPDSAESLSAIPDDADLYTWFRGKPIAGLLQPFLGEASAEAAVKVHFERKMHFQQGLEGGESAKTAENELSPGAAVRLQSFVDIVEHPNYDQFWQERNPLRHLKNVRPAVMVVGGLYDAEDAWGPEHTLHALREQNPEAEVYGVFGPWTHGGWRKDPDFLERIEAPVFEYYLEGKGEKPAWRDLLISTGSEGAASEAGGTSEAAAAGVVGENLAPGKAFLTDISGFAAGSSVSRPAEHNPTSSANFTPRCYPVATGRYISDPANPVPYMAGESHWRDKAYMWADQRFASGRPDVLTQALDGPLAEDLLAVGPVTVHLRFSVQSAPATETTGAESPAASSPSSSAADGPNPAAAPDAASPPYPASQLDLDLVVKILDIAPDGTQTLVRGDVCPARWRNSTAAPAPLVPGEPAELAFQMASVCHRFVAGHTIALQIQSSWFPLVAMNPQTFLVNPYTATTKDYRPVEVSILAGSNIILP